ncbi:MAG: HEAT repeat domain-containing protein [Planctomycetaceae bacterium]|nr:HEAT repeat domain-containing protein [Planctomycetaceae bacterium]
MAANVSHWIEELSSDDVVLQGRAAEELAKMGPEARPAAIPLIRHAGCADETLREWVVAALESLGSPHVEDLDELRQLVTSDDPEVRYWAITFLGRLEKSAGPAVPDLVNALQESPDRHNRERAAWALGKIGPAAKDALPALHAAVKSQDARLERIALLSIAEIEGEV